MRERLRRLRHRLAHRLGWYSVELASYYRGQRLRMSAKCTVCGLLVDDHEVDERIFPPWCR